MAKLKNPTIEEFNTAILWLENNEGEGFEKEACTSVMNYLINVRDRQEVTEVIREVAKEKGVSPANVRASLRKVLKEKKKAIPAS